MAETRTLPPTKTLDAKLARLLADPGCRDFILADAKDADMAFGLAAPGLAAGGPSGSGPFRSLAEFRDQIRAIVAEGLVDALGAEPLVDRRFMLLRAEVARDVLPVERADALREMCWKMEDLADAGDLARAAAL